MWRPLATLCFLLGARCEAKKLNFFQISDLHLDSRYSEDGSVRTACHDIESNDTDGNGQGHNSIEFKKFFDGLFDVLCDAMLYMVYFPLCRKVSYLLHL